MSRKRKAEQDKQEYYQRLLILNMKLLTHIDSKIEKTKSECKLLMSTPPTAIVQREGISVTLYKPYLLYKNKDEKEEAPFERLSPSISSTVYCLNRCYTFLTVGETRESRILKDGIAEIAKEAKISQDDLSNTHYKAISLHHFNRGSADCKEYYMTNLSASLNHTKFSSEEMSILGKTALMHGGRDWEQIASIVGNKRTALDCFRVYKTEIARMEKNSPWTSTEDAILEKAAVSFGSQWSIIAQYIDGRTGTQCAARFIDMRKTVKEVLGRWRSTEDNILKEAVEAHGKKWDKVSEVVGTRTNSQCKDRWNRHLQPKSCDKSNFSQEEVSLLKQLVEEHGEGKWALLSPQFVNRDRITVRNAWLKIQREGKKSGNK